MALCDELERTYRTRELIERCSPTRASSARTTSRSISLDDDRCSATRPPDAAHPARRLADTLACSTAPARSGSVERIDWAFRALAVEDMLVRPDLELHLTRSRRPSTRCARPVRRA